MISSILYLLLSIIPYNQASKKCLGYKLDQTTSEIITTTMVTVYAGEQTKPGDTILAKPYLQCRCPKEDTIFMEDPGGKVKIFVRYTAYRPKE